MSKVIIQNMLELLTFFSCGQVSQSWKEREADAPGAPVPFSVHEQDRALIRDNVIQAVVHAPDILRSDMGQ